MTIRTRLTLLFLSIVSVLLFAFCASIYLEGELYRQREYKTRLRQEALTAATILFEQKDNDLLKLLAKNHMTVLNQEEVLIFDTQNQVVFESGSNNPNIKPQILTQIRQQKELFWEQNDLELFGMVFKNNNKDFIVLASAVDKYGLSKQRNLALMLLFGGLLMLLISSVMGWFFAGRLLLPIKLMIQKIDTIRASQLGLRLDEGNQTDELAQLSIRFNQMLDRLEKSFKTQRSFVSHASHELRTPLTAITGQIQVSLLANDNPAELRLMIQSVLDDVQQLNKLTNNLLDLTSIDADDTQITLSLVNVAELIWHVRSELLKKHTDYNVLIVLDENPEILPEVQANESLLFTVLINLIENGAKFSPQKEVSVTLNVDQAHLIIVVNNEGAEIPPQELKQIFEPFRRGSNARHTQGHGVGLSLVKRIVQLHHGQIEVVSTKQHGTTFTLTLKRY
jgi:signal transduction histidine kinase